MIIEILVVAPGRNRAHFQKTFQFFFCYNFLIYKKSYLFVTILLSCNFFFYTKYIYIFAIEKDT